VLKVILSFHEIEFEGEHTRGSKAELLLNLGSIQFEW
jgi:hypothetical protein